MSGTGISYYRKRKGLTQLAVAELLGVPEPTMSHLEAGDRIPTAEQVDKLVEILGIPPSYLFSKNVLAEVADRARAAS